MPPEPLNSSLVPCTSRTRFAAGNLRRWLGRFWSAPSASPFFIQGVAAAYERGRDARRQLRHVLAQRLRQHAAAEGGAAEHGRQGRVRRRRALGGRDDLTDVRGAAGTICGPLALACLVEPPDGDSVSLELRVQVGLGHGRRAAACAGREEQDGARHDRRDRRGRRRRCSLGLRGRSLGGSSRCLWRCNLVLLRVRVRRSWGGRLQVAAVAAAAATVPHNALVVMLPAVEATTLAARAPRLPFCCWPGAQARPHCLLHAILWRRDVWDALTRGRPGSRVLAKVLTPTHLAFGTRSPLHPHQVCRGEGNQRIRTFLPAAQSQLRGKTRAGLALSKRVLRTRPLPGFTRPVARGKMGYTDCQNEIFKRVEQ